MTSGIAIAEKKGHTVATTEKVLSERKVKPVVAKLAAKPV